MQYRSTRGNSPEVDSAQAVLTGLAPDGGLYLPERLPEFDWRDCVRSTTLEMAEKIFERHTVLSGLLMKMGVSVETAAEDACKIEHVISDETLSAIKRYLQAE